MACEAQRVTFKRLLLARGKALSAEKAAFNEWRSHLYLGDKKSGQAHKNWMDAVNALKQINDELKTAGQALWNCIRAQR